MLFTFLGLAVAVLAVGQFIRHTPTPPATTVVPAATALPPPRPPLTKTQAAGTAPGDAVPGGGRAAPAGAGEFGFAEGSGPVLGSGGPVRHFKVGVERSTGRAGADFADQVDRTLGDARGWTADGGLRLQRVPATASSDFTIYLADSATAQKMCAAGGLTVDPTTSCRMPGQVVINATSWAGGIPGYGAPLGVFRAYVINHEVGHQLGYGHEACPGPGRPAPVMMEQAYGLQGCVPNAWPNLGGHRYAGNSER